MPIIENIQLAIDAIRGNKLRAILTMLGIIIGISSVITITSIGASAEGAVSKEFESYGVNGLSILPDWQQTGDYLTSADLFNANDIDALKNRFSDDIEYIAPNANTSTNTKVGRNEAKLSITGVSADYNRFSKSIQIIHGRMINQSDVSGARNNIVIDAKAATYLFGKEDVVGKTLTVPIYEEPRDLTIVGVYSVPASIFTTMDTSSSYRCYMAHTTITGSDFQTYILEIFVNPDKNVDDKGKAFASYLARIKNQPDGYFISQTNEGQLSAINNILNVVSVAIGAIAAISLLVGGIGIMNIMLVSVTERTREIGIRKSLGARTKDILSQFLIEAMILSVIGGIIGTALGLSIAALGMALAGIGLVINFSSVLLAITFSAAVGLFFGWLPAKKAAKLDPIEALRYE